MNPTEIRWRMPAALFLLWLAAGISLTLALAGPGRVALPGCADAGPDCDSVLTSAYAWILGLPAAWMGVVVFSLFVLTSGAWARREPTLAASLGGILAGVVLGGALWFVGVQAVILRQWCPWCLAAHVAGFTAVLLLFRERGRRPVLSGSGFMNMSGLPAAGLTIAALAVGGSAWSAGTLRKKEVPVLTSLPAAPVAPAALPAGTMWPLGLGAGNLPLDLSLFPTAGVAGAPRTAFLLTDYTCAHCRDYGPFVEEVASEGGMPVRLILLPASRDAEGAAIHRVLLTVFHADPAAWRVLHGQLLSGSVSPHVEDAVLAARTALGDPAWRAACAKHGRSVDLAISAARTVQAESRRVFPDSMLPQLLAGGESLMGAEGDRDRVRAFLSGNAQDASAVLADSPVLPRPPTFTLLRPDFDLGALPAASRQAVTLRILNSSLEPQPAPRLEMPEGCLVLTFPRGDIAGTSTAEIQVECTVPDSPGEFQKLIVLHAPASTLTARLHGSAEHKTAAAAAVGTVAVQSTASSSHHAPVP